MTYRCLIVILAGIHAMRSQPDNTWMDPPTVCGDNIPRRDGNSIMPELDNDNFFHDDIITMTCLTGYGVGGSASDKEYSLVCNDGDWEGDGSCLDIDECSSSISPCSEYETCINVPGSFLCLPDICGAPPVDKFAITVGSSLKNGGLASYICIDGYGLQGSSVHKAYARECNAAIGVWSDIDDFCEDVNECTGSNDCSSDATCTNTVGSYICTCKPGYTGDGKKCQGVPCGPMPVIQNSLPVGFTGLLDHRYPDQVVFQCEQGQEVYISGISTRGNTEFIAVCTADGSWIPFPLPTCRPIYCGEPDCPYQSTRSGNDWTYSKQIGCTCNAGYQPKHQTGRTFYRTCQGNGEWSEGDECVDIDECTDRLGLCGSGEYCINVPGSYLCLPLNNVAAAVVAADPCGVSDSLGLCSREDCSVQNGRALCKCPSGYTGARCNIPVHDTGFVMSTVGLVLTSFVIIGLCSMWISRSSGVGFAPAVRALPNRAPPPTRGLYGGATRLQSSLY